jgi:hypothetical protein
MIDIIFIRMLRISASMGALLLGIVSLIGYILQLPFLYRWGSQDAITPPMAINTAVAISLLAIAQLLNYNRK